MRANPPNIGAVNDAGLDLVAKWRAIQPELEGTSRLLAEAMMIARRLNNRALIERGNRLAEWFARLQVAVRNTEAMFRDGTATWERLKSELDQFSASVPVFALAREQAADWLYDALGPLRGLAAVQVPVAGFAWLFAIVTGAWILIRLVKSFAADCWEAAKSAGQEFMQEVRDTASNVVRAAESAAREIPWLWMGAGAIVVLMLISTGRKR